MSLRRRRLLVVAAALLGAVGIPAVATAGPAPASVGGGLVSFGASSAGGSAFASDPEALNLLRAAFDSGRRLQYVGRGVVGVDGQIVPVVVTHGRDGSTVCTLVADSAARDCRATPDGDLGTWGGEPLALLRAHYALVRHGVDRIAGRVCSVVDALRADGTTAARFWIDRATSLLLSRESYDTSGMVYESATFTDVWVRGASAAAAAPVAIPARPQTWLQPSGRSYDPDRLDDLRTAGWVVPADLPAGLTLYDARVYADAGHHVLHLSYSDGLSTVSVFEERGLLDGRALQGWQRERIGERKVFVAPGAPARVAWQARGLVIALVAAAPSETIVSTVGALPYGTPHEGVLDRVGRGFQRLGALVDPFN